MFEFPGFNPDAPAYFYVLSLSGPTGIWFYKGGITNNEVEFRIRNIRSSLKRNKMPLDVKIVETI